MALMIPRVRILALMIPRVRILPHLRAYTSEIGLPASKVKRRLVYLQTNNLVHLPLNFSRQPERDGNSP